MERVCDMLIEATRRSLSAIVVVACILVQPSAAQQKRSDWQFEGLTGRVQKIQIQVAKLFNKSGKWHEGKRVLSKTARYDEKGKMVEEVYFEDDPHRYLYTYDSAGTRFMQYEIHSFETFGDAWRPTDKRDIRSEFIYDADGNRIEERTYQLGILLRKIIYSYDRNGRRKEAVIYGGDGKVLLKEVYAYDGKGVLVELSQFKSGGLYAGTESYSYEYDPAGNRVRKTTSKLEIKNGQSHYVPVEVTYRSITYY